MVSDVNKKLAVLSLTALTLCVGGIDGVCEFKKERNVHELIGISDDANVEDDKLMRMVDDVALQCRKEILDISIMVDDSDEFLRSAELINSKAEGDVYISRISDIDNLPIWFKKFGSSFKGYHRCSGTLINGRTELLTAMHCMFESNDENAYVLDEDNSYARTIQGRLEIYDYEGNFVMNVVERPVKGRDGLDVAVINLKGTKIAVNSCFRHPDASEIVIMVHFPGNNLFLEGEFLNGYERNIGFVSYAGFIKPDLGSSGAAFIAKKDKCIVGMMVENTENDAMKKRTRIQMLPKLK